ncbi:MAG: hypothetical protein BMS9Abin05_1368 [Rhodothermia bacterium]|nr:MAG: hypothetical protein BMS9Abin05_1368 [Rhodothermia bacterium]
MQLFRYSPRPKPGNHFILFIPMIIGLLSIGCQVRNENGFIDRAGDEKAILDLLMTQQQDWNNGDIAAFMTGYLDSDSLRFASRGAYRFGWQATIDRYYATYPDSDAMGSLTISELDVEILSNEWATAFGRWNLQRGGDYEDIGGLFTLLLVRTDGGWLIKYDHTSQAS